MSVKASYWRKRFSRWRPRRGSELPGYALLVPVPGDLPVFLEIALAVTRLQDPRSRLETIVVADRPSEAVAAIVAAARPTWRGPLRSIPLPVPERWLLPRLRDPGRNHAVQLVAGVQATRASHIVLHDADLFLFGDVHEEHYQLCRARGLSALGLSPVWDGWFADHGLSLAATWDLVASTRWLRATPPWQHFGHDAELFGETHTFDTTLWAQAHTPAAEIAVNEQGHNVVHFNYVISTYRHFQRASGVRFDDTRFLLVLIRLFTDCFASIDAEIDVPSMSGLADCLTSDSGPVAFPDAAAGMTGWGAFRDQVERILAGAWVDRDRAAAAVAALGPFDAFYGRPRSAGATEVP